MDRTQRNLIASMKRNFRRYLDANASVKRELDAARGTPDYDALFHSAFNEAQRHAPFNEIAKSASVFRFGR